MYKNFSLDNQERKEIMEMHKSHGYRKPISELRGDMFYGEDGDMPEVKPDDSMEIKRNDLLMVVSIARKWCEGKENFPNCQEIDNLYNKYQLFM